MALKTDDGTNSAHSNKSYYPIIVIISNVRDKWSSLQSAIHSAFMRSLHKVIAVRLSVHIYNSETTERIAIKFCIGGIY